MRNPDNSAANDVEIESPDADHWPSSTVSVSTIAPKEITEGGFGPARSTMKRLTDIVIASAMIAFFAPLMAIIYILVRADGGPGIFIQKRIGKDGALFPCFKFRSMSPDAEQRLQRLLVVNEQCRREWDTERKLRNDPRITRLGLFLRRKSLDELPQLFNVLRGEMSLVGPRPITPDEAAKYGANIGYYMRTRPGLTGAWQVSGRNDLSYEQRVALDVDYATNWRWPRDFAILFRTVGVVLSGRGAS